MKKLLLSAALSMTGAAVLPQTAFAVSQDECAIWLCLPSGFPSGCGAAKSAMKHRLKHGRSPLPNLASCMVADEHTNPKDFTYSFMPKRKMAGGLECVSWDHSGLFGAKTCTSYKKVPVHYERGSSCYIKYGTGKDAEYKHIDGCISVVREIKIFEKGKLIGNPYYF